MAKSVSKICPNLLNKVVYTGSQPKPFPALQSPMHKVRSMKAVFAKVTVEEVEWLSTYTTTEQLSDE